MTRPIPTGPPTRQESSGGMAYYTNTQIMRDVALPIRKSPVRFGVLGRNGLSSNSWGVYSENSGNIYVACRDNMKALKISLHQSGKQHIAFTSESGLEMTEGSRFWDQWWDPQLQNDTKIVPSFSLMFPSWGLGLNQATRDANPKVWGKNQLLVEAAETPEATVVSFVFTDDDLEMRFSTVGESRSFPLAILPARAGKKLWVIAKQGPEGNMKELAGRGIGSINVGIVAEKLKGFPSGHVLGMCVTGFTKDGGAYMLPFPAQMHWKESEQMGTS